jgi:hypothetical protein
VEPGDVGEDGRVDAENAVTLDSGLRAVIRADRWIPGAYELVVDGTPQSHVNLDDPTELFFEYVSRMGHVIDRLRLPGEPITALHLGAGGLTIPRYIEATRPGSRQQVVELEPKLVELVRSALPLPRGASIRVRYGDAGRRSASCRTGCAAPSTCSSSTSSAARSRPRRSRAASSTRRARRSSRPTASCSSTSPTAA